MGIEFTRKCDYTTYVYLSILAGIAAMMLLILINSIIYFSGFCGKVFRAPLFEETVKSVSLLFVIKRVINRTELPDLNIYTLGAFTGLTFGVLESIMTYMFSLKLLYYLTALQPH